MRRAAYGPHGQHMRRPDDHPRPVRNRTIGTKNRVCLFGKVVDGKMHLNEAGHRSSYTPRECPVVRACAKPCASGSATATQAAERLLGGKHGLVVGRRGRERRPAHPRHPAPLRPAPTHSAWCGASSVGAVVRVSPRPRALADRASHAGTNGGSSLALGGRGSPASGSLRSALGLLGGAWHSTCAQRPKVGSCAVRRIRC